MENTNKKDAEVLAAELARYWDDPYGYVIFAFPWGQGQLKGHWPRAWQIEIMDAIGKAVRENGFNGMDAVKPLQLAVASGHGIGKSALSAWLIKWIMDTRPHAKGTITSNTNDQLRTKTWAELGKWHEMSITAHLFSWHNSKGNLSFFNYENPATWRCDGQTCREENSESFAGQHNVGSTSFYLFDEASAVPDKIYEVANGGLTDGEPMWFCFGNPTRNEGWFRRMFGNLRHRWITRQIDSRTVKGTNKELLQEWVDDHGEDSDFVRVRVRGMFPRASDMQFIGTDSVAAAMRREAYYDLQDALVCGIDVARGGADSNVIYFRRGMDARTIPFTKIAGEVTRDTTAFVTKIVDLLEQHKPDAVFVDSTGVGGPVADRLRQLNYPVFDVGFGETSPDKKMLNMTAFMWSKMRDAIRAGLALPNDPELEAQLTTRDYTENAKNQLVLESKKELKKRGVQSPDIADGLALTYAMPVARANDIARRSITTRASGPEYNNSNHVSEEEDY